MHFIQCEQQLKMSDNILFLLKSPEVRAKVRETAKMEKSGGEVGDGTDA